MPNAIDRLVGWLADKLLVDVGWPTPWDTTEQTTLEDYDGE